MGATTSKVVCTASHPVDLDDGTTLGPGQQAEKVDINNPHNSSLIDAGFLTVLDGEKKPHGQQTPPNDTNGGNN